MYLSLKTEALVSTRFAPTSPLMNNAVEPVHSGGACLVVV